MTDPKAGIANIKKKVPVPKVFHTHRSNSKDWYPPFQRKQAAKSEVSDYNSKPGKLEL